MRRYTQINGDRKEIARDICKVTRYRERIKKSFGVDPFLCGECGNEMELEGIWHPGYRWIVDRRDNFLEEAGCWRIKNIMKKRCHLMVKNISVRDMVV